MGKHIKNKNSFLFLFYPESSGAYSAFAVDFGQATSGNTKYKAERMAGDLLNILVDLEEYTYLKDDKNRKKHWEVDPDELYYEFTGDSLSEEDRKSVYYKYIYPRAYYIKE